MIKSIPFSRSVFVINFLCGVLASVMLAADTASQSGASKDFPSMHSRVAGRWQLHEIRQLGPEGAEYNQPALLQIVTAHWNRVAAYPYMAYMPEKDRLIMLVTRDDLWRPMVIFSQDHGASWSHPEPVITSPPSDAGRIHALGMAYLGGGKLLLIACDLRYDPVSFRYFSDNYGERWRTTIPMTKNLWDPPLVDRDLDSGKVVLYESAYDWPNGTDQDPAVYIRTSEDLGLKWSRDRSVMPWLDVGASEVALVRAANGDLIGACRTNKRPEGVDETVVGPGDHYTGLGISVSKDNGLTWSSVNVLYHFGRHHPSMVVMPNDDIIMTYVVRKGYPKDSNGFEQFGIEAVISQDHGQTWDIRRRYVLHQWSAYRKDQAAWRASSQNTSTVQLPEGDLLTAFGTGYRKAPYRYRSIGLVRWRITP